MSAFDTRAAEKLRKQDGRASLIQVFAHTSPHREGPRFSRSIVVPLARDLGPLMPALDGLNARYGKGTVHVASTGQTRANQNWSMRQERRTPRYTTEWSELPTARA